MPIRFQTVQVGFVTGVDGGYVWCKNGYRCMNLNRATYRNPRGCFELVNAREAYLEGVLGPMFTADCQVNPRFPAKAEGIAVELLHGICRVVDQNAGTWSHAGECQCATDRQALRSVSLAAIDGFAELIGKSGGIAFVTLAIRHDTRHRVASRVVGQVRRWASHIAQHGNRDGTDAIAQWSVTLMTVDRVRERWESQRGHQQ